MPLYIFKCTGCPNEIEELMKFDERDLFIQKNCCGNCHSDLMIGVTMPAKMAEQWAGWQEGLASNMFSKSLGRRVVNQRQEAEIAKSMGFVPLSDLPKDFVENKVSAQKDEDEHFDKMNNAYQEKLKEGGGTYGAAIRAVEELMPAKQMLQEAESNGNT